MYEYKVMPIDGGVLEEAALNELGAERWRLISITWSASLDGPVFTHVFIREKKS